MAKPDQKAVLVGTKKRYGQTIPKSGSGKRNSHTYGHTYSHTQGRVHTHGRVTLRVQAVYGRVQAVCGRVAAVYGRVAHTHGRVGRVVAV